MSNIAYAHDWSAVPPDSTVPSSSCENGIERWLTPVRARIEKLLNLDEDWDSYGAPKIAPEKAQAAIEILQIIMDDDIAVPEIVPTVTGSVQLEWGSDTDFLEVEVISLSCFACLSQDGPDTPVEDFEINYNTSPLRDRVSRFRLVA